MRLVTVCVVVMRCGFTYCTALSCFVKLAAARLVLVLWSRAVGTGWGHCGETLLMVTVAARGRHNVRRVCRTHKACLFSSYTYGLVNTMPLYSAPGTDEMLCHKSLNCTDKTLQTSPKRGYVWLIASKGRRAL